MDGKAGRILTLAAEKGVVRSSEVRGLGVDPSYLNRLAEAGHLERIGRGLYALPRSLGATNHRSLVEVAVKAPNCVVCLLTALAFHQIGTQSPPAVWIAIPTHAHYPQIETVATEVVQMSPRLLVYGAEIQRLEGVNVRITSPAKTVVDCFRYRSRVGTDVAVEALREALRGSRVTLDEVYEAAIVAKIWGVVRPYAEALS